MGRSHKSAPKKLSNAESKICPVEIAGHHFRLRTSDAERLEKAVTWLNYRIKLHLKNHPLLRPTEVYLLLLVDLAFEREDFQASGKELLKQTEQLIQWIDHQL